MARVRCWSEGSSPPIVAVLGALWDHRLWGVGAPGVCHDSREGLDVWSVTELAGLGVRFTVSSVSEHHNGLITAL